MPFFAVSAVTVRAVPEVLAPASVLAITLPTKLRVIVAKHSLTSMLFDDVTDLREELCTILWVDTVFNGVYQCMCFP